MSLKTGLKARVITNKDANVSLEEVFEHEYCSNSNALSAAIAAAYGLNDVFKSRSKTVKDRNGDDLEITTHYLTTDGYKTICDKIGLEFE